MAQESTIVIDKFLGLHLDSTDGLNIEVGELNYLKNIRITENYKMRKREGYLKYRDYEGYLYGWNDGYWSISEWDGSAYVDSTVRGIWYGKLGGSYKCVYAMSGHVYEFNLSNKQINDLGTLTDARTYFFAFNDKLYIQNGNEYKYWTGTGTIATVDGYIPKITIDTTPAGVGEEFELLNSLNGKARQTFNGDGTSTTYKLNFDSLTSVDKVYINGVLKTLTTDYTVNLTNGTVTFVTAPPSAINNVEIYWTKGTGERTFVTSNKQSVLFGGANDSRVFMYGVGNSVIYSEQVVMSGLIGIPSAEYFPIENELLVGSDEYNVTHLSKQYDRLLIHKEKDTHYCSYEFDATNGASFPTYPLNDSIGNVAFGEGRNVLNNPYVITKNGVFQFNQSNVRDERNAQLISSRVELGLIDLDLTSAITMDWESKYEYWIAIGNKVYIYNYKIDVWYYFELFDTPTCFVEIEGECYFGTTTGKIMKFSDSVLTDNNETILSNWELGYLSFGANYLRKFLNFGWVGLKPEGKSKCVISWLSDYGSSVDDYTVEYNLIDFGNVDFSDFTFSTNDSPRPFRLKLKIKKFTYMQLKGENNESTYGMTIQNITLPATVGGMSK